MKMNPSSATLPVLIALFLGVFQISAAETNLLAALRGTWTCSSAIVDGKPLPPETVQKLRLILTESRYKTEKGDEVLFDSTYRLDQKAKPIQISMVGTEGGLAGKEAQGILDLANDELTICYTMPGKARPASFKSEAGSAAYLIVWRRKVLEK